jgi:hypothetical protein
MASHQPRPKKADLLKQGLAASGGTLAELQSLASSLNLMEDRYMARPAAELLVERGDPSATQIAKGLALTPVLGRDPNGDLLRTAFKNALAREGIPANVEEMARRFYGGHAHAVPKKQPAADQKVDAFGWETPPDTTNAGGILGVVKRLFGGGS